MEDVRSMRTLSRRQLLRLAIVLPSAGLFNRCRALAAPHLNRVKITGIRAIAIKNIARNCLIRVDTDGGLAGYGEAGRHRTDGTRPHQNDEGTADRQGSARRRFFPGALQPRRTQITNPEIRDSRGGLKRLALQAPVVRLLDRLPGCSESLRQPRAWLLRCSLRGWRSPNRAPAPQIPSRFVPA